MGSAFVSLIISVSILLVLSSGKVDRKRQQFYARSSKDLRNLAQTDFELLARLRNVEENLAHGDHTSPLTTAVDTYLRNFRNSTTSNSENGLNATEHVEEILRNPLSIFTVIHRCAHLLHSLRNRQSEDNPMPGQVSLQCCCKSVSQIPVFGARITLNEDLHFNSCLASLIELKSQFENDSWPLQKDLADAAEAILQIEFMYNLKAADLAGGNVHGISTQTRLQANHCLYIGRVAKFWKKYTLAVDWFLEAQRSARIDGTVDISTVNAELVELIKEHDKILWSQGVTDPYFFMKPLKSIESIDQETVPRSVKEILQNKFAGNGTNCSFWPMNVWRLCSGQNLHTPEASSHLFCWHEFKVDKTFTVGPLRMEFLSRNPDFVQVHGAFTNAELAEATASSVSHPHVNSKCESAVEQKVERMTGLLSTSSSAADPTLRVSHLPGGRTDITVDTQEDLDSRGDWISTVMIYLNDVKEGGFTAFPANFATAMPIKASAVFWFNTFSDGSPDYSTAHEECPVVWGEKQVAYKRMRFYDQFQVRKCSLQPKERFQVLVNGRALPVPQVFAHKTIDQMELDEPVPLSVGEEAEAVFNNMEHQVRKYAHSPGSNLDALVQLDWEIYQNVKHMFPPTMSNATNSEAQSLIRRCLQDFNEAAYDAILTKTTVTDTAEAVSKLSGNPLAVYRTFWRFENYIKKLLRLPAKGFLELREVRDYIGKVYNESDGPLKQDLEDAMSGILITQFAHDLKSQDIARGIIAGVDTGIALSAKQCLEVGSHALTKDYYYQAINWMETAVSIITSQNDTTVSKTDAREHLDTAKKVHDKILATSVAQTKPTFYTNPVLGLRDLAHAKTRKEILYEMYKRRNERQFADINLIGLCQGKRHQTVQEQSKLFCWHEHRIHPYFKVGPLQVELFAGHPKAEVVVYHNILSKQQLAFLRNDTGRSFRRSAVEPSGETNSKACLSAKALLYGSNSEQAFRVLKSTSMITGLSATRRTITVQSYNPGGHYSSHVDTGGSDLGETETEAMATFMYYVTEPELGGGTAFPQAGAHVSPTEGSAVFWFNTLSSVDMDHLSSHGGCPVIFGEKRVATIFIPFGDQIHGTCHTDRTRRMEVLVNGKSKYGYE